MGLKEWLVPQDRRFFELIEKESKNLSLGVGVLAGLAENYDGKSVREGVAKLKQIEGEGDAIVHAIFTELNRSFILPLGHEDISVMASRMDNVLDLTYGVVNRCHLYKIARPTRPMVEFVNVLAGSVKELDVMLTHLKWMKGKSSRDLIDKSYVEVNRLENVADDVLNTALADLLNNCKKNADVINIIKLKEIYEKLEMATDECEDVANIVYDIAIRNQ